jgi:hypothetical protein
MSMSSPGYSFTPGGVGHPRRLQGIGHRTPVFVVFVLFRCEEQTACHPSLQPAVLQEFFSALSIGKQPAAWKRTEPGPAFIT